MSDNTDLRGGQDRSRVAGDQEHEVRYFAEKHGISQDQVRDLIAKHGNSREELEQAAARLSRG